MNAPAQQDKAARFQELHRAGTFAAAPTLRDGRFAWLDEA